MRRAFWAVGPVDGDDCRQAHLKEKDINTEHGMKIFFKA
jgi:hypothetical protein